VVRAADLDHHLLAGDRAGGSYRRHHALGAGAERAVHLDVGHVPVDQLGQLEFVLVEESGHRAGLADHGGHLFVHRAVVAAKDGRAAGLQEIDVRVAVPVGQVGALGPVDRERERVVEGQVVLDAAGDPALGALGDLLAGTALGVEVREHVEHRVVPQPAHRLGHERPEPAQGVLDVEIAADRVAGRLDGVVADRLDVGQLLLGRHAYRRDGPGDLRRDPLFVLAELAERDLPDRGLRRKASAEAYGWWVWTIAWTSERCR
jgi:hypothetical protein